MRKFKRVAAVGLTVALTVGTMNLTGLTAGASGMPTTDGHDKYVNQKVFQTINSSTFGTEELTSPLFDKTKGSSDITNLLVPTLAYDDTSIGLVWDKPEKYDNVADYNVYINGTLAGTARENFKKNAEWTATYMKAFYDYYTTSVTGGVEMVNVDIHSYRATGLKPETEYTFKVVAIDSNGNELGTAKQVSQKTAKTPEVFNVLDYGAKTSEAYVTYNDEINTFIVNNTKAIQAAIDACTPGGKVVIPEGTFVTGALWLKSDMTLEVNGTLWASPNSDHFEIGFLMYPFYTDTRGWGLVNAMSADEENPIKNVRVTGTGTLFGNGWKYGSGGTISGDGYTRNSYTSTGDVDTTVAGNEKYALPRWVGGSNTKVFSYGIQAMDSAKKYLANVTNPDGSRKYSDDALNTLSSTAYSNDLAVYKALNSNCTATSDEYGVAIKADLTAAYATRSSLLIMRNCENVYVGDITIENPANHSVNILDSRNISTTNVKVFSFDGNNADGLGFGCSQNVICWNNFTDTGDDNLGFGASVGEGARDCDIQTNSEVWMFNNYIHEGHGGLAAGSHTGNGIQDVLFEDTVMNHIDMAFRFKSAPTNGGFAANITMRDCAVADTNQGWVLTTSYSDPNSASSTEAAEIGNFYNFASYNVSVYGAVQNTICVFADVDRDSNPQKPWHTHNRLYFQDITFSNVGGNGSYKYYSGWDTLTGCEKSVFYNVKTISYNSKAVSKKTNKAWTNIKYCKDIIFQGTTMDSLNANTDLMNNVMTGPVIANNSVVDATSAANGQSVDLSWTAATDQSGTVKYGVDTYVGDTMVDTFDGKTTNACTVSGLSAGVTYTFKIYASDATGNRTLLGEKQCTTTGTKDTVAITAPADSTVTTSNPIYTCAQAAWAPAAITDARVRGYKVYVNGTLNETIYNYQIPGGAAATAVSRQVGRLTPGTDNQIKVVAFTDAGVEYEYSMATAKTLLNYDYKAPVFGSDAKVTATPKENGDVVLSWDAATDDTAVGGYRVYVDGKAVLGSDEKAFNPVNGAKTTKETTYTVSGLDLSKEHTFTIQAGDTWWKAETVMGTYDKMAGYNWTVKGISTTLDTPFSDTKNVGLGDNKTTEVKVDADRGVLPSGTQMTVNNVTSGDMYEAANKAFGSDKFMLFNIALTDGNGVAVAPNGNIKVSLKVPDGFTSEGLKVYAVAADGTKTAITAEYVDGYMVFTTDQAGAYTIVQESSQGGNEGGTGTSDSNVQTGDLNPIGIYVILLALAMVGMLSIGIVDKKRKLIKK
jgi:exo-poly-alpha-galacturonosidase